MVNVAATQMPCTWDIDNNIQKAEANREEETVLTASFDFDKIRKERDL